jgi:hypothetical protein
VVGAVEAGGQVVVPGGELIGLFTEHDTVEYAPRT